MKRARLACAVGLCLALAAGSIVASADDGVVAAYNFFKEGGVWRVRVTPEGDADKQLTWTVLVLCGKGPKPKAGEVGGFELSKPLSNAADAMITVKVLSIFQNDSRRAQFVSRFADGVASGEVQAFLVLTPALKEGKTVPMEQAVGLDSKGLVALFQKAK